jgi:hypothetical protein
MPWTEGEQVVRLIVMSVCLWVLENGKKPWVFHYVSSVKTYVPLNFEFEVLLIPYLVR